MGSLSGLNKIIMIYSPTVEIMSIMKNLSETGKFDNKILRIFLDVRGAFVNVHGADGNEMIAKKAKRNSHEYSQQIINFVNRWKSTFKNLKVQGEIVLFSEHGSSDYHNELLNGNYKKSRRNANAKIRTDYREIAKAYIDSELKLVNKLFTTPGTGVLSVHVQNLEVDCAAHAIITSNNKDNYFNLIMTKDKDMAQSLHLPNTVMLRKQYKGSYTLYDSDTAFYPLKIKYSFNPTLVGLALSIIGDQADSIPGVSGIAEGGIIKFLNKYEERVLASYGETPFEKLISFCEEEGEHQDDLLVKKLNKEANRKKLAISWKLVDFDELIKDNKDIIQEQIINRYNKVICDYKVPENIDDADAYIKAKQDYLHKEFYHIGLQNSIDYHYITENMK